MKKQKAIADLIAILEEDDTWSIDIFASKYVTTCLNHEDYEMAIRVTQLLKEWREGND